jgi:hypothetical protein
MFVEPLLVFICLVGDRMATGRDVLTNTGCGVTASQ